MSGYNPHAIEKKWQARWLAEKTFASTRESAKPKYYALDMFPYPSGEGLHVGHPEGYTASDIVARYKRACGYAVMHPMGWDAFGLPAEQYALKTNTHPQVITQKNIERFRAQLQAIGFSYDWDRQVNTTDPDYYRWTQWIFLQLFDTWFDETQNRGRPIAELISEFAAGKRALPAGQSWDKLTATEQRQVLSDYRLAYLAEVPVNWCPGLGTVLANEEVIDGKSEVGGFLVERRPMRQWMLRITAYAQRLLDGLADLDWPESLKLMQRNWIGRSEGAEVEFLLENGHGRLTVFTTRPDTLFGATYMVIAPEHPLIANAQGNHQLPAQWPAATPEAWRYNSASPAAAVAAYQKWAAGRSDRQRQEDTGKTGVFTGLYAINPVQGARIPIFASDYVLMGYGSGAIMAVPAHDERDFEFAGVFGLPITRVVSADASIGDAGRLPLCDPGYAVNSGLLDGMPTAEAKTRMINYMEEKSLGRRRVQYKLRDWLFSRQRYWGEPFPLVHLEDGTTVALADDQLPVRLPPLDDFKPTGTMEPPLSKAQGWRDVVVLLDGSAAGRARIVPAGTHGATAARRELNTMPQWAGSCWYYLRYMDPRNSQEFCSMAEQRYWLGGGAGGGGVDLYIGGVEHAVLHLLYSRFWHKVLFDRGLVACAEPFAKLVNQGLILGEAEFTAFAAADGRYVSTGDIEPDWGTQIGPDGRPQHTSRIRSSGEVVVGRALEAKDVEKRGEAFVLKSDPNIQVDARSFKMSKSRGNVVNPDDVIADYGADSLRLFEMFMGPLEQVKPWSTAGVEGVYRFLQRLWRNLLGSDDNPGPRVAAADAAGWKRIDGTLLSAQEQQQAAEDAAAAIRHTHRLVRKVTGDIERLSFNTAISAMMEFNNTLAKLRWVSADAAAALVRVLEPFAPHIAEELYSQLWPQSQAASVSLVPWPRWDEALCVDAELEVPVQISGKLSGRVKVPAQADEDAVFAAALADEGVQAKLAGRPVKKKIYVKGRMVNLVV